MDVRSRSTPKDLKAADKKTADKLQLAPIKKNVTVFSPRCLMVPFYIEYRVTVS